MCLSVKLLYSILGLCVVLQTANAATDIDYNSVDIGSLQNEYRSQLSRQNSKAPRSNQSNKRQAKQQLNQQELQQYRQLLAPSQSSALSAPQRQRPVPQGNRKISPRKVVQQRIVQPRRLPVAPVQQKPMLRSDSLFEAASRGDVGAIGKLLQQGMNVNVANAERETALHMAAAKGHYSAVIYLLNHGANINSRTINNWLPIHHATRFRHAQIAHYLKQRGASPYAKTSDGMSAIDMAKANRDLRILGVFGAR